MRIAGDVVVYRGRFAPSPTGALHAGSLVAALASWLDARAHGGAWLVRIEDIDAERCLPGMGETNLAQLAACGLVPDEAPVFQSTRPARYRAALVQLGDRVYGCACSRRQIQAHWQQQGQLLGERLAQRLGQQHGQAFLPQPVANAPAADAPVDTPYPGTCRAGMPGGAKARSLRLRLPQASLVDWRDRRLGAQHQDVAQAVGDFALARCSPSGEFMQATYQLAVVVDDAEQGITDIVRGEDLADNTPRQRLLQDALGVPVPRYLHTPLVLAADGQKLSKQTGARALDTQTPAAALQALSQAAQVLGLSPAVSASIPAALDAWITQWDRRWHICGDNPRS